MCSLLEKSILENVFFTIRECVLRAGTIRECVLVVRECLLFVSECVLVQVHPEECVPLYERMCSLMCSLI
jgi:hypothetical protein